MKITNIAYTLNSYKNNQYNIGKKSYYNYIMPNMRVCSDTFIKEPSFKGKTLTIDWYKSLTKDQLDIIHKKVHKHIYQNEDFLLYNKSFNKKLQYHDTVAAQIKSSLNSMFGSGNYIVIPIGRSLSSVGKCLGYKIGEDNVKPLPMSRGWRFLNLEKCKENFDAFSKYLDSVGLSKEEVEKSNKHYVFIDYCCSGGSLRGVENLFESKIWGHHDNVQFKNLFDFLPKELDFIVDKFGTSFLKDLEKKLKYGEFKKYSQVEYCINLADTEKKVIKPEEYDLQTQVFYFKLLENEMRKQT